MMQRGRLSQIEVLQQDCRGRLIGMLGVGDQIVRHEPAALSVGLRGISQEKSLRVAENADGGYELALSIIDVGTDGYWHRSGLSFRDRIGNCVNLRYFS